jgi:hypothetical protein
MDHDALRLPDYQNSLAILVGTSKYEDSAFPDLPAAANSLNGLHEVLTDQALCAWPPERIEVIGNPADARRLVQRLRRHAEATTDVLFLYFVGHGVVLDRGHLALILHDTEASDPDITGLEYERVRLILRDSPARVKIIVLDCCYSGRAIEALSVAESVADSTAIAGAYTLAASDHTAHVVPFEQQHDAYTSFTGQLLELLRGGLPGADTDWLTLNTIYVHLRQRLNERGLPAPNQRATDTADHLIFARNVGRMISNRGALGTGTPHRSPTPSAPPPANVASEETSDPSLLQVFHDKAQEALFAGEHMRSLTLAREVLEKRTKVLGEGHQDTAQTRVLVGWALYFLGRYNESEACAHDAVDMLAATAGSDDLMTLGAQELHGWALCGKGEYAAAATIAKRLTASREQFLGPDYPETLAARHLLATALHGVGDDEAALQITRQTAEIRAARLGADHLEVLESRQLWAAALHGTGKTRAALRVIREVVKTRTRLNGEYHADTFDSLVVLATILRDQEPPKALEPAVTAAEGRARIFGPDDKRTHEAEDLVKSIMERLDDDEGKRGIRRLPPIGRMKTRLVEERSYDPALHHGGGRAAQRQCSWHGAGCKHPVVASVLTRDAGGDTWHAVCSRARDQLRAG